MMEVVAWGKSLDLPERPWLVLGKGPSFALRDEFDLTQFNLFALNHVVREMAVDVAHAIDFDVVEACAESLLENARWLIMPRFPHVDSRPTRRPLEEFVHRSPTLQEFDRQERLVWYNLGWGAPADGSPIIPVRHFSSEAALSILGLIGVKTVRSLGVDGGRRYSATFSDLTTTTLLANEQPTFDVQFEELDRIAREYALDYQPLVEPLRVFVGCDPSQALAARVLEYTIKEHASRPVDVQVLPPAPRAPRDPRNQPRTAFSFSRFMIPALCGYEGRALYVDADMQVFADVAELWRIPFDGAKVLCTSQPAPDAWKDNAAFHPGRQLSVMMLDCGALDWDVERIIDGLDRGDYTYEDLMFDLCIVQEDEVADLLPPEWNHLERYEPGLTKLSHYTVVPTQPWKNGDNPLAPVWEEAFKRAVAAGDVTPELVVEMARAGYAKASLVDAVTVSRRARVLARLRSINRHWVRRQLIRLAKGTGLLRITRPLRRRPPQPPTV